MNPQTPASWQELMAFAFGVLKLTPDIFWAMTPREFDAAAAPYLHVGQVTERGTLAALMREFPDT
jgi:uncharacterized phage protein (TIGR02216 family)